MSSPVEPFLRNAGQSEDIDAFLNYLWLQGSDVQGQVGPGNTSSIDTSFATMFAAFAGSGTPGSFFDHTLTPTFGSISPLIQPVASISTPGYARDSLVTTYTPVLGASRVAVPNVGMGVGAVEFAQDELFTPTLDASRAAVPDVSMTVGAAGAAFTPTLDASRTSVTPIVDTSRAAVPYASMTVGAAGAAFTPTLDASRTSVTPIVDTSRAAVPDVSMTVGAAGAAFTPTLDASRTSVTPILDTSRAAVPDGSMTVGAAGAAFTPTLDTSRTSVTPILDTSRAAVPYASMTVGAAGAAFAPTLDTSRVAAAATSMDAPGFSTVPKEHAWRLQKSQEKFDELADAQPKPIAAQLTWKDAEEVKILEFREQIINDRRWPIRVISKTITHDSVSFMMCKGQDLYFEYSEEEVHAQTQKSTSKYYATSKTNETIAQVCKKNQITQEELVARNLRLDGIERQGKKAKFKANTYLNVGDVAKM